MSDVWLRVPLAVVGLLTPWMAAAQTAEPVRLETGLLAGVRGSDTGIMVYRGVPFAAPPVGDLRWRPPEPAHPWQGVRHGDTFVTAYWANFATRGNPNGAGLPEWPAFREAPRKIMELGEHVGPREMPADDARRAFFDARLGQR